MEQMQRLGTQKEEVEEAIIGIKASAVSVLVANCNKGFPALL